MVLKVVSSDDAGDNDSSDEEKSYSFKVFWKLLFAVPYLVSSSSSVLNVCNLINILSVVLF